MNRRNFIAHLFVENKQPVIHFDYEYIYYFCILVCESVFFTITFFR